MSIWSLHDDAVGGGLSVSAAKKKQGDQRKARCEGLDIVWTGSGHGRSACCQKGDLASGNDVPVEAIMGITMNGERGVVLQMACVITIGSTTGVLVVLARSCPDATN
jgi:hypothetical protein